MAMVSIRNFSRHRSFIRFALQQKVTLAGAQVNSSRNNHTICKRTSHLCILARNIQNKKYNPIYAVSSVRWSSEGPGGNPLALDGKSFGAPPLESKSPISIDESTLPPVPSPPVIAEAIPTSSAENVTDLAVQLASEPSLSSYGLAGWSPVGMAQQCLEYIHITLDLPWWGSIVVGTLVLRTFVFPLVIKSQRNAAKMANNMPQMQRLQERMSEARQSGNKFEAARAGQEMMMFMKEKKMNPIMNILPPLAQAPLFISMFMALRGMCDVPVESLREGGMLWFLDLTVPDQYYLLPIITSLTLAATVELGTDSAKASALGMMRYALRAIPIIIFPFTINFPGAILCYWVSTNFISLVQVGVLRIPKVRSYFKIEPLIIHSKDITGKKKGFVEGFKESMTNMKISRELNERENHDFVAFKKAGRAPILKTFKHDPTKPRPTTTNELLAKKKDS